MPYNPVAFKERDLRRAVRAADKEGLIVSGFEIGQDERKEVLENDRPSHDLERILGGLAWPTTHSTTMHRRTSAKKF